MDDPIEAAILALKAAVDTDASCKVTSQECVHRSDTEDQTILEVLALYRTAASKLDCAISSANSADAEVALQDKLAAVAERVGSLQAMAAELEDGAEDTGWRLVPAPARLVPAPAEREPAPPAELCIGQPLELVAVAVPATQKLAAAMSSPLISREHLICDPVGGELDGAIFQETGPPPPPSAHPDTPRPRAPRAVPPPPPESRSVCSTVGEVAKFVIFWASVAGLFYGSFGLLIDTVVESRVAARLHQETGHHHHGHHHDHHGHHHGHRGHRDHHLEESGQSFGTLQNTALPPTGPACAFTRGDGRGGKERSVGMVSSPAECEQLVKAGFPAANGATVSISPAEVLSQEKSRACFAEFGMKATDGNPQWQTCLFPPAAAGGGGGRHHQAAEHSTGGQDHSRHMQAEQLRRLERKLDEMAQAHGQLQQQHARETHLHRLALEQLQQGQSLIAELPCLVEQGLERPGQHQHQALLQQQQQLGQQHQHGRQQAAQAGSPMDRQDMASADDTVSRCEAAEAKYCTRGATDCSICLQVHAGPLMAAGCHANDFANFCMPWPPAGSPAELEAASSFAAADECGHMESVLAARHDYDYMKNVLGTLRRDHLLHWATRPRMKQPAAEAAEAAPALLAEEVMKEVEVVVHEQAQLEAEALAEALAAPLLDPMTGEDRSVPAPRHNPNLPVVHHRGKHSKHGGKHPKYPKHKKTGGGGALASMHNDIHNEMHSERHRRKMGQSGSKMMSGACWEAKVVTDYPDCAGYEAAGYTCVGHSCAAVNPGGTPDHCAQPGPAGSSVDPSVDPVWTGSCRTR